MGCLHGNVARGRLLNNTYGLSAIQSKTHLADCIWTAMAYQSKGFQKKSRSKTLIKTMPKQRDSDNFRLRHVGEYFTNFSNQNVWGKHGKSINVPDFSISSQNAWSV